ncbi:hypothetical protein [Bradyrhizobium oligotrophicum]|uniref:hypothetical protein n=1 Tax=Bradyrhizobium TaxID=374 RepID=UPI003EBE351D
MVSPIRKPPILGHPPVQLETSVPKGGTKTPNIVHPDGHDTAFSIPAGKTFVVTDVSVQRLSVLGTAMLLEVSLTQDIPSSGGTTNRWSFVGETTANVERTFSTGIAFSTPFVVRNGSQSGDTVVVRLWGFFR